MRISIHPHPFLLLPLLINSYSAHAAGGVLPSELTTRNFPLTLPGIPILVGKHVDPKTGIVQFVSQSDRVKSAADLFRLELNEEAADLAKHGVIRGKLRDAFYAMKDSDWVDIQVRLRYPAISTLDPESHSLSELKENEHQIESVKPLGSLGKLIAKFSGGLRNLEIQDSGTFTCRVNKGQIEQMRFDKEIDNINYSVPLVPAAYPFSSLASSAYNPSSSMPSTSMGQGVNAATFETGIANNKWGTDGVWYPFGNLVNCLSLVPSRVDQKQPIWTNWVHSQQTFKCLWQAAPYANHFHHKEESYTTSASVSFLSTNAIQTVSMSVSK